MCCCCEAAASRRQKRCYRSRTKAEDDDLAGDPGPSPGRSFSAPRACARPSSWAFRSGSGASVERGSERQNSGLARGHRIGFMSEPSLQVAGLYQVTAALGTILTSRTLLARLTATGVETRVTAISTFAVGIGGLQAYGAAVKGARHVKLSP